MLVDAVEAVDPHGRFATEFFVVVILAEMVLHVFIRFSSPDAIGMMCLVVHDQDVAFTSDLAPENAFHQLGVTFDVANRLHQYRHEVSLPVTLLFDDGDQTGGPMHLESIQGQVAFSAQSRRFEPDADGFPRPQLPPGAKHLRRLPRNLDVLRLKYVPVRDKDASPRKLRQEVRRNKIARTIETCFSALRFEFLKSVADRHVGTDYEHHVRVARVAPAGDLVENAPCRQHSHHCRLAGSGRHLARVATKSFHSFSHCVRAWLVEWDVDPLKEIFSRFGKKNDRFSSFKLRKKQPMPTPFPAPVAHQLHASPGYAALTAERQTPPLGELGANSVDQLEFDGRSGVRPVVLRHASRRPIKIHGWPSARTLLRRVVFRDAPISLGFFKRGVEDRLGNFVCVHGSIPKALQIASSFSNTSG